METAEVKKLTNQRRTVIKRVKAISECRLKAQDGNEVLVKDFRGRFESLAHLVNNFDSLHMKIVGLMKSENELMAQDRVQGDFDDMHYSIQVLYQDLVKKEVSLKPEKKRGTK